MYFKDGGLMLKQGNHTIVDSPRQLTVPELLARLIQYTGTTGDLTLPTGPDMDLGVNLGNNMCFDFYLINSGLKANIAMNSNWIFVGNMMVDADSTACFRIRKTATQAFTIYRLS